MSGLIYSPFDATKAPRSKNRKLTVLESKLADLFVRGVPEAIVLERKDAPRLHSVSLPFLRSLYQNFVGNGFLYPESAFDMRVDFLSVGIDHDGSFLFLTGKHRLAMARLTQLETIPVNVAFRHSYWQERREAIVKMAEHGVLEISEDERNHPDIATLIG